jgi:hypothetical protein
MTWLCSAFVVVDHRLMDSSLVRLLATWNLRCQRSLGLHMACPFGRVEHWTRRKRVAIRGAAGSGGLYGPGDRGQ